MRKIYLYGVLAATMLAGCNNGGAFADMAEDEGGVALRITSGIETRAYDNVWEADDVIGVYMLNSGQNTVAGNYANVPYVTRNSGANGLFNPLAEVIYLPANGDRCDFTAYYPYREEMDGSTTYTVDLTEQDDQNAIDFMVAGRVADKSRIDPNVSFEFVHKLVKIVMAIEPGAGVTAEDLKGLSIFLTGQRTTAAFDVTGTDFNFRSDSPTADIALSVNADGTAAEGIVFPCENYDGMKFVFRTAGIGDYEWVLAASDKATKFETGRKYRYTITVNRTGIDVSASIADWISGNGDGEMGSAE